MRLNKFLSQTSNLSRRKADEAIVAGRVTVNETVATIGQTVDPTDVVTLDGNIQKIEQPLTTIMLNKPVGYVCSREGQGSKTVYDLIPSNYHHLNLVGRLDKNSSGLLLLTNDGQKAYELTHPSFNKTKRYTVKLQKPLDLEDQKRIQVTGVELDDGASSFELLSLDGSKKSWEITMHEGRNRQIRRTFEAVDNIVVSLHRTSFGEYELTNLKSGEYSVIN